MSPIEYRSTLSTLGLSIVGAAPVLGISRRQSQRFAAGDSPVPGPIAKLLAFMQQSARKDVNHGNQV